ncbi:hypothetical protein FJV76_15890 [Mesorhizobium sp. WSM4303]|uniref:hypothetical protein n=1 Tax=unclassified Mesorhizobium TaxID=325217 RepID=UPI00115EA512|nr:MULTISPECIES: hypothetical protein [unclassified Mesorhizobium]TRD03541.1 hypothetical protein FJV76_15890 [Mesorhizobium sp. WSM4303]
MVSKGNATLEGVAGAENDEGGQNGQGETDSKGGDGYLDRVAKYVPAEVVAFFIFVNSILDNAAEEPVAKALATALDEKSTDVPGAVRAAIDTVKMAGFSIWNISWIVLIIALAMTPIYLKSVSDAADSAEAPGANIVMSMLAFPFWAYAVNALALRPWHDGALASIMLATFTLISGAIRPEYINAGLKLIPGMGPKK